MNRPARIDSAAVDIRPATLSDSQAIFDAHRDSVLQLCCGSYSAARLQIWFDGRTHEIHHAAIEAGQIFVAKQNGRVLGFAGYSPGEVTLLFVRPEAAGSGLGSRLLALVIEEASAGHDGPLTVVATINSRRFYETHGFVEFERTFFVRGASEARFEVALMRRTIQ